MTTREAFLAERQTGIGGSDCAAILGLDPHRTPLDVYLEKRGESTFDGNEATELGTDYEPKLAEWYERTTGKALDYAPAGKRHPEHEHLLGHIDGLVIGEDLGVELKHTGNPEYGEPGTDEVPVAHLIQCQVYAGIWGLAAMDLAACLWRTYTYPRRSIYHIPASPELFAIIAKKTGAFWRDHVLAGVPPEPVNSDEAARLWSRHTPGVKVELAHEQVLALAEFEAVKAQKRELEKREKELKLILQKAMRDGEVGTWQGEPVVNMGTVEKGEYTVKASSYRSIRATKTGKALLAQLNEETGV